MEKSIRKLVGTLEQANDGKLTGGFGHVKGGVSVSVLPTNSMTQSCNNGWDLNCQGSNFDCTNSVQCSGAQNSHTCSNSGLCVI